MNDPQDDTPPPDEVLRRMLAMKPKPKEKPTPEKPRESKPVHNG